MLSLVSLNAENFANPIGFLVVFTIVCLSAVGLYFTNYRYLLGYFVMGMFFSLLVEILQRIIQVFFTVDNTYLIAFGILLILTVLAISWLRKDSQDNPTTERLDAGSRPLDLETTTHYNDHIIHHSSVAETFTQLTNKQSTWFGNLCNFFYKKTS